MSDRSDPMLAREGHEEEFRATWCLAPGAEQDPQAVAAYEYAATHRLTMAEMNYLGPLLMRREPERPSLTVSADVDDRDRCVATIDGKRCPRHGQMYLTIAIPPRLLVLDDSPLPSLPQAAPEVTVLLCLECAAPAVGDGTGLAPAPCLRAKSGRPWTAR